MTHITRRTAIKAGVAAAGLLPYARPTLIAYGSVCTGGEPSDDGLCNGPPVEIVMEHPISRFVGIPEVDGDRDAVAQEMFAAIDGTIEDFRAQTVQTITGSSGYGRAAIFHGDGNRLVPAVLSDLYSRVSVLWRDITAWSVWIWPF